MNVQQIILYRNSKTFNGYKIKTIYLSPGCLRNAGVAFPFIYERLVSSVLGPTSPVHAGPAGASVVDIVGLRPRPDDRVIRAAKIRSGAVITVLIILSNLQGEREVRCNYERGEVIKIDFQSQVFNLCHCVTQWLKLTHSLSFVILGIRVKKNMSVRKFQKKEEVIREG